RGIVKAPTGDKDAGTSTGKADFLVDFIASKELHRYVEFSGYAGYEGRGQPDGVDTAGGAFRWGVGGGFATRFPLHGELELNGIVPSSNSATITGSRFVAFDGSISPIVSATENLTRATAALTWQHQSGFFLGGGVSWNVPMKDRDDFR